MKILSITSRIINNKELLDLSINIKKVQQELEKIYDEMLGEVAI